MTRSTIARINAIWGLLGGDEVVDQILSGKKVVRVENSYISSDSQQAQLPKHQINTQEFYAQQGWLNVRSDLKELLNTGLLGSNVMVESTAFHYLDLNEPKTGHQILEHISPKGVFRNPVNFFAYLSILISAQRMFPLQEVLADEGLASIFFVHHNGVEYAVVAYVGDSNHVDELTECNLEWNCTLYDLGEEFGVGDRVFYQTH
ncbi:MAG: hypothetical protein V4606_00585 [Patescibacteria group bacterium]